MKKPIKKDLKQIQESPLKISAAMDEVQLLQAMVENLARHRVDPACTRELMPASLQAVGTSSLEAFVSGNLSVSGKGYPRNMPFISCFLFTCTKALGEDFTLSWSSSLS